MSNINKFFYFLFPILTIILFSIPSFFFYVPSYSWWLSYAYFEQNGLQLYDDVNLVFPSVFIKLNALFLKMTDNVAAHIMFGIFRVMILFIVFFKVFRIFSDFKSAAIGSFIIVCFQMMLTTYIPDDYHIFERIMFGLTLFFLLQVLYPNSSPKFKFSKYLNFLLLLISCVFLILSKQNIGVLVTIGVFLALLREFFLSKIKLYEIILTPIIFIFLLTLICNLFDMSIINLYEISINNDSKGSLLILSTNFLIQKTNLLLILIGIVFGTTLLLIELYFSKNEIFSKLSFNPNKILEFYNYDKSKLARLILEFLSCFIIIITFLLILYQKSIIVVFAVGVTFAMLVISFKRKESYWSLCYVFGGLLFASSMTSEFASDSAVMIFCFLVVYLLSFFFKLEFKTNTFTVVLLSILLIFTVINLGKKFKNPYSWWGLHMKSIASAKYVPPYEQLKDIRVDFPTYEILKHIKESVNLISKTKSDVYFYPHIPFFYLLHNKLPPTKNPVLWFDVIKDKQMKNEIRSLDSIKPELIVMFDPPNKTYIAHKKMKDNDLPQIEFVNWINRSLINHEYSLVKYKIFQNSIPDLVNVDPFTVPENIPFTIKIEVINEKVVGKNVRDLLKFTKISVKDIRIISLNTFGVDITEKNLLNHILSKGDYISIESTYQNLELLISLLGTVNKKDENWYSLKIYKRKSN